MESLANFPLLCMKSPSNKQRSLVVVITRLFPSFFFHTGRNYCINLQFVYHLNVNSSTRNQAEMTCLLRVAPGGQLITGMT